MINIKKISAIVIAGCMLFSLPALASDTSANKRGEFEKKVVTGIGILNDFEIAEGASVTRGELAHATAELLNISGKAEAESSFSDVKVSTPYSEDIYMLSKLGVLRGYGDGTFKPNEPILLCDAVKVFLSALGYDSYAESEGGYMAGYLAYANRTRLLSGIEKSNLSSEFSSDILYILMYNALDINIISPENVSKNGSALKEEDGKTALSSLHHIYKAKGVVEATEFCGLDTNNGAGDGNVIIGGIKFKTGDVDMSNLLGCHTEYYYKTDDNSGEDTLLYALESTRNNVLLIDAEDLISVSGGRVSYIGDNELETHASITSQTDIVYNGGLYTASSFEKLNDIENGSLKLIDNNSDGKYEVIVAENCRTVFTTGIDKINKIIYDKYEPSNPIKTEDYADVKIYDRKGHQISIDSLDSTESLLMCTESMDKSTLKIQEAVNEIIGTVTEVSASGKNVIATINGTEYKASNVVRNAVKNWKLGDKVICYLDTFGKIAGVSEKTFTKGVWGYIDNAKQEGSSIMGSVQVRMFDGECADGTFKVFDCTDTFTGDDTVYKNSADILSFLQSKKGEIVLYFLNADGKISKIESSSEGSFERFVSSGGELVYDGGSDILEGKLAVDTGTLVFMIPEAGGDEKDFRSGYVKSMLMHNSNYNVTGAYRKIDGTLTADVLVVTSKGAETALSKYSPLMYVKRVTKGVDDEGNVVSKLCGYVGSQYVSYVVADNKTIENMSVFGASGEETVQSGDLIRYELNGKGELKVAQLLFRTSEGVGGCTNPSDSNYYAETRLIWGYVYRRDGMLLLVAVTDADNPSGLSSVSESGLNILRLDSGCSIFKYVTSETDIDKKITTATTDEIFDYKSFGDSSSRVAVFTQNGYAKGVVIIK